VRRSVLLALLLCPACQGSRAPAGPVYRFADTWGTVGDEPSCSPHGEVLTLRGRIELRSFRKVDGAILRVGPGEEWILGYRAEGVLLELDGELVEVTGRACTKNFQAMSGDHFDLATLVVLSST
jgi:hypothetical protein